MKQRHRPHPSPLVRKQHGLVLVIALILMAVIGISSSAAIRLALTGNALSLGLKAGNEAMQKAEIALRWCEYQTRLRFKQLGGADSENFLMIEAAAEEVSQAMANDYDQYIKNSRPVPANILAAAGLPVGKDAPRCLSQAMPLAGATCDEKDLTCSLGVNPLYGSYTVTVRASSNDFREATQGSDAGSEVWLRSALLIAEPD